jgi:hypothetical protein
MANHGGKGRKPRLEDFLLKFDKQRPSPSQLRSKFAAFAGMINRQQVNNGKERRDPGSNLHG